MTRVFKSAFWGSGALGLFLISSFSWAQTTRDSSATISGLSPIDSSVTSGVSQTDAAPTTFETRFSDSIAIEYSNTFIGPSLSDPTTTTHYDDQAEDHQGSLVLENAVLAGYRLSPDITLGAVTKWNWHAPEPNSETQTQAFELLDPYLKLSHNKLYSAGNFSLGADLRLSAPISRDSKEQGLMTSFASEQVVTYEIPRSPFALELTTFIQGNFYRHEGNQEGDHLELHFSPAAKYQLAKSLSAKVTYELTHSQARFSDLTAQQPEGSLVEVGLTWNVTENLKVAPNIHTRTSRPLMADSLTLGAKVDWALL